MQRAANPVHAMQCRCRTCRPSLQARASRPSLARRFVVAADAAGPGDLGAALWGAALGLGLATILIIANHGPRLIAAVAAVIF